MIAILGATGVIGLALARQVARTPRPVVLFARNPAGLSSEFSSSSAVSVRELDSFDARAFDVVVNALGAGDPARVRALGSGIIDFTRFWDERVLAELRPQSAYVFISSGAVHLGDAASEVPYVVAKRDAEARHRRAKDRSVLDVRVFGFADTTLPLNGSFFLCDIARSVAACSPLVTSGDDFRRDYAGSLELADLLRCWEVTGAHNMALDLYTKSPLRKLDLLTEIKTRYGIDIQIGEVPGESPTGAKSSYVSMDHAAAALGYDPQRSSMEVVLDYLENVRSLALTAAS